MNRAEFRALCAEHYAVLNAAIDAIGEICNAAARVDDLADDVPVDTHNQLSDFAAWVNSL